MFTLDLLRNRPAFSSRFYQSWASASFHLLPSSLKAHLYLVRCPLFMKSSLIL